MIGLLNSTSYLEADTDGCSGDSYTTTTSLTAETVVGGVWTATVIAPGTVISGASKKYQWRIMAQDMCLTLGSCDFWEVGPGAPGISANGFTYYPPDLSGELSQGSTVAAGGTGWTTGDKACVTQTGGYGDAFSVTATELQLRSLYSHQGADSPQLLLCLQQQLGLELG